MLWSAIWRQRGYWRGGIIGCFCFYNSVLSVGGKRRVLREGYGFWGDLEPTVFQVDQRNQLALITSKTYGVKHMEERS